MRFSVKYLIVLIVIFVVACGPSDEEKARVKLNLAKTFLEKQDTTNALIHLDSISTLFPEAIYSANVAKNLINEINFDLFQRKEAELDSLKIQFTKLEKSFVKEKTQFDRFAQYIHKRQTFQRAWDRSYIQVHLDERGELYLSSNYHGENWLNHTGLRVYDQGDDAKTETIPLDDVNNHRSDFMEAKWEKVSYRNGKDNGAIEFIANNAERRLKAVFLGKEYYYIILETYDKQAVKDALALSKTIKRTIILEAEIQTLQGKLQIN
ncbi:MAG: hypothetical protein HN778_08340 [Prolixibacteraceae bacterium]|jgi:hypothetical protein|nr:hypothetical protein [Prolixibacteraceae bacterium]MBT6763719.1 hypothetical protein [Prolixibacteraceae bacterium]MBT7000037.1 hypothetical protein [Prolixibacteraceae bacterium]MBT7394826.1 hypothetical protein [Prolixibacteraceae bacterium]